jgi:DNA-binding NarL/FixJ family response regulator
MADEDDVDAAGQLLVDLENLSDVAVLPIGGLRASVLEFEAVLEDPLACCVERATMSIDAFAERARRELLATGETVRKRTVETRDELTAQEAQIARLARDGLSNPEIGTRLFISPGTVKYHLRKVFTKLDISSRNQLDRVLPSDPTHIGPS